MIIIQKSIFPERSYLSDRVISFVASDQTIDRDNDVILAKGWDLTSFEKNPVFLWNHISQGSANAIGKIIGYEILSSSLKMDVEFASKEIDPFAEQIYQKYRHGFLNAVSVGFAPIEYELSPTGKGYIFTKQTLHELSGVNIPANPNAVQMGADATEKEKQLIKHYSQDKKVTASNEAIDNANEKTIKAIHDEIVYQTIMLSTRRK